MTDSEHRRDRRGSLASLPVALFVLLILYVLSFGPMFALYARYEGARRLMRGPFQVVYYPLLSVKSWIDETTWGEPLDQCFDDYIEWWRR